MTTPAQLTGSAQMRVLANHPAAAELLTAASEGKLISVPDAGGAMLYQQSKAGHTQLSDVADQRPNADHEQSCWAAGR